MMFSSIMLSGIMFEIVYLICYILGILLPIVLHEFGHTLGYWKYNYYVDVFHLFGFYWQKNNGRYQFHGFSKKPFSFAGVRGIAKQELLRDDKLFYKSLVVIYSAGIVVNFILTLLFMFLAFATTGDIRYILFFGFFIPSLLIFLASVFAGRKLTEISYKHINGSDIFVIRKLLNKKTRDDMLNINKYRYSMLAMLTSTESLSKEEYSKKSEEYVTLLDGAMKSCDIETVNYAKIQYNVFNEQIKEFFVK